MRKYQYQIYYHTSRGRYFDGYGEVKLRNLQQYYVFFYEKKGGKVRGVLGKDRTKDLLK